MNNLIKTGIIGILYLAFITLIYVGAAFITNILFNKGFDPECVGLDNNAKIGLARFTIVIFWIGFIPTSLLPILIKLKIIDM